MLRGYRGIVVAVGLILAAANHPNIKAEREQTQAQQSISDSLGSIASAYDEQAERTKRSDQEEAPCGEGKYGSSADLCAQWKAADAAANSAWWAWAAAVAGVVSTVGVILALGIGWHSNWIARDAAKRQLRAYINIEAVEYKWLADNALYFVVVLKNTGQTPAQEVVMRNHYGPATWPLAESLTINTDIASSKAPLAPGGSIGFDDHVGFGDEILSAFRDGTKGYFVWGLVSYLDAFNDRRETGFRYYIGGDKPNSARPIKKVVGMNVHASGNYST